MTEPRITHTEDGVLDEVFTDRVFSVHLERMDNTAWWIGIYLNDGSSIQVHVGAVNQQAKPYGHAEVEHAERETRF